MNLKKSKWYCTLAAAVLLSAGAFMTYSKVSLIRSARKVEGTVVERKRTSGSASKYRITVEYEAERGGAMRRFTPRSKTGGRASYGVGQTVMVYERGDREPVLAEFTPIWGPSILLFFFGGIAAFGAVAEHFPSKKSGD